MIPLHDFLIVGAVLFGLGLLGIMLNRSNVNKGSLLVSKYYETKAFFHVPVNNFYRNFHLVTSLQIHQD